PGAGNGGASKCGRAWFRPAPGLALLYSFGQHRCLYRRAVRQGGIVGAERRVAAERELIRHDDTVAVGAAVAVEGNCRRREVERSIEGRTRISAYSAARRGARDRGILKKQDSRQRTRGRRTEISLRVATQRDCAVTTQPRCVVKGYPRAGHRRVAVYRHSAAGEHVGSRVEIQYGISPDRDTAAVGAGIELVRTAGAPVTPGQRKIGVRT